MNVKIKEDIAKKLKKRFEENDDFKNVEEYVNYILKQVAERLDSEKENSENEDFSEEDEAKVKERLKSLGYLD
jgi:hypothetical protein